MCELSFGSGQQHTPKPDSEFKSEPTSGLRGIRNPQRFRSMHAQLSVPEPRLQNSQALCAIGFFQEPTSKWRMRTSRNETLVRPSFSVRLLGAVICLLTGALPLLADTPSLLRGISTGGCYCHCAESKVRGGCVKMCESGKYAYRWWATSCAKPHMSTPRSDSHAGPRFAHPRRTEHAKL